MSIKKLITGLTLSLVLACGGASAADFSKGLDAFNAGDYKTTLSEWIPLAEQGDVYTQHTLGVILGNGNDAIKDIKSAVKWYTLAAKQGDARAQSSLGSQYRSGEGDLKDNQRAYMWFSIASFNGNQVGDINKSSVVKEMTPADVSKAQAMSSLCLESNYTDC